MGKYIIAFFIILISFESKSQVKLLTLSELEKKVAKGNDTTYVINFWATWCGPCVEELPNFEKLQQDNLNKPLKVILISLDFKSKLQDQVIPFVNKHNLKSQVYIINEPDQQRFIEKVNKNWSGALPATLFINTKRKIRSFYEQEFTYEQLINTISTLK